jgi:putative aminopeptidase FrvX
VQSQLVSGFGCMARSVYLGQSDVKPSTSRAGELAKKPKFSDLWIDIGASSRIQAEAAVGIGDLATFQSGFQHLVGDLAMARAFDNKAGVFIIGEAMRLLSQEGGLHQAVGVYSGATVQEEIGSRGAQTAAFALGAQSGLAVDMGHARDVPGNESRTIRRSRYRKRTGHSSGC